MAGPMVAQQLPRPMHRIERIMLHGAAAHSILDSCSHGARPVRRHRRGRDAAGERHDRRAHHSGAARRPRRVAARCARAPARRAPATDRRAGRLDRAVGRRRAPRSVRYRAPRCVHERRARRDAGGRRDRHHRSDGPGAALEPDDDAGQGRGLVRPQANHRLADCGTEPAPGDLAAAALDADHAHRRAAARCTLAPRRPLCRHARAGRAARAPVGGSHRVRAPDRRHALRALR